MVESVLYKLEGKSRETAMRIGYILHSAINKNPITTNDYQDFLSIKKHFNEMAVAVLRDKTPELLSSAGIDKPYIQIFSSSNSYPRAYTDFPKIFLNPTEPGELYMQCPVDYKGKHFIPEDGIQLTEDEKKAISQTLFSGGWSKNAPLLEVEEDGVAIPDDFDEGAILFQDNNEFEGTNIKVYKAFNRSLHVVEDFLSHQERFGAKVNELFECVRQSAMAGQYAHGDETIDAANLHADMGIGYDNNNNPHVFLSLLNPQSQNPAQAFITPVSNETYIVEEKLDHRYRITPNENTEEGKLFKDKLNSVKTRPDLGTYWQLYNPTAPKIPSEVEGGQDIELKVPQLETIDGEHYLLYSIDPKADHDASCPPDAIPVSIADYLWIKQDAVDKQMGITLPPKPASFGTPAP